MNKNRDILVDICWTLFYSNTTYDFLKIKGRWWNSLIYKLFRKDIIRSRAIKQFNRFSREEQLTCAEQFYTDYMEPRKINEVWHLIEGKDIILVSQTMDILAETVAKHIGAKAYYATQKKEEIMAHYSDFDIITDNMSDIELIKHAKNATIIIYNNLSRWKKILPPDLHVQFIETGREKY